MGPVPPDSKAPAPSSGEQVIARTPDYEISTAVRAGWLVTAIRGRYDEKIIDILRAQVFKQKLSYAFDLSGLNGITVNLARELYFLSNKLKTTDFRLTLVNPGDKIRSLIGLISPGAKLPSVAGVDDLPADPKGLEEQLARVEAEHGEIRKNLQTNPVFQFVDRESCWLCPFCGQLAEDVKIGSRVSIPAQQVELVYRHLHRRCKSYSAVNPKFLAHAELDATIKRINGEKFSASKQFTAQLETKVRSLETKATWADSFEQSMKIAVDRQKRLLPSRAPEIPGCEVAISYRPAQQVSGDFYDFIDMGEGRMGISLGDVAGHGIEAGILMGMTKKVLNIRASELRDPVEAMKRTNVDIYPDMDRQTFVTAFLGMYDPATRRFTYARAGHNPPLLINRSRQPTVEKLEAGGLMLGMSQAAVFDRVMQGKTLDLRSGDVLLFYTDGLEEAKNRDQELFGLGRCQEVVEQEADKPASYILGALSRAVDKFSGDVPQEDDITTICLKIL